MKTKDIFQYALAAVVAIGFFALLYIVFLKGLPPENKEVGYQLVGALTVVFTTIVNYFFSSTKGSSEKTEIISKLPAVRENDEKDN